MKWTQSLSERPKVAFIDIETAPILATVWTLFEANAVWVERDTFLLGFAVQWMGEKDVKTHCLPDYPGYQKNKHNDGKLVADLWKILNEADVIIAHNGDSFDVKKINARLGRSRLYSTRAVQNNRHPQGRSAGIQVRFQ